MLVDCCESYTYTDGVVLKGIITELVNGAYEEVAVTTDSGVDCPLSAGAGGVLLAGHTPAKEATRRGLGKTGQAKWGQEASASTAGVVDAPPPPAGARAHLLRSRRRTDFSVVAEHLRLSLRLEEQSAGGGSWRLSFHSISMILCLF
jgi:hypothetical protein